jgi:hypothetical protein
MIKSQTMRDWLCLEFSGFEIWDLFGAWVLAIGT